MQEDKSYITSASKSNNSFSTPTKEDINRRRETKKKMAAFKTFLGKIEHQDPLTPLPPRKFSGELIEQKLEIIKSCKICEKYEAQKPKECIFCNDMVCSEHIRKKRRDPKTNKFARICDQCEDSYLYKRYLKNEMKHEESLVAQEAVLQIKLEEITDILKGKRTKMEVLRNKKEELQKSSRIQNSKLKNQEESLDKRTIKIKEREYQNLKLENELKSVGKQLPRSLELDYTVLVEQNQKLTRDLVVHQKWCSDVIKAISQREKAMYEQYYQWQQAQKQKIEEKQKKEEECIIY